jgi:glycosyltransferase involved in cell wall biosynthesis
MRNRCKQIELLLPLYTNVRSNIESKRVLFLLPAGSAGGGGNIVLLEAAHMRTLGVDVWIANLKEHRDLFVQNHPDCQIPVTYIDTPDDLLTVAPHFDAIIATLYLTVFWMKTLLQSDKCPVLGYYVQDFEPDFFDENSPDYQIALASYTAIPDLVLFTKTNWNRQMLKNKLGVSATVIGPSLDVDCFHPSSFTHKPTEIINILAMVRPSTPRRVPKATMQLLNRLAKEFGSKIQITIFGVNADDAEFLTYPNDFPFENLGQINLQGVADALSNADIFIDCSIFQAMGLTAMEAMASGVAVVGPVNGGLKEIITDGHNGMLVDTQHEDNIFSAVALLISDSELRTQIQRNALEVLAYSPIFSSRKILDCLFPQTIQTESEQPILSGELE